MNRRLALLVSAVLMAIVVRPAWAGHNDPPMTFTRSPAEGPPGSVIEVSGTGCIYHGKPYQQAYIRIFRTTANSEVIAYDFEGTFDVQGDGSFIGQVQVPRGAPPGAYGINATCYADDMAFPVGEAPFAVTAPPLPTTQPPPTTVTTAAPPPTPTGVPSTSRTAADQDDDGAAGELVEHGLDRAGRRILTTDVGPGWR